MNGLGFFVDNTAPGGGNGSQATPFNNLAAAIAAASAGDTIFVYRGDGTSTNLTGAINLPNGVDLIGEGQGLILAQVIEPQGQRPVLTGPITLGGNNTVSGLQLTGSASDTIVGSGVTNVTIDNNVFSLSTNAYIELANVGGSVNITDNTFNPLTATENYVFVNNVNTNANVTISNNDFIDDGTVDPSDAVRINSGGTSVTNVDFLSNDVSSNDNTAGFDNGLSVQTSDTSDFAITATGNTFTDSGVNAMNFLFEGSVGPDAVLSNNTIDGMSDDGIDLSWGPNTTGIFGVTIEGNTITDVASKGLDIDGSTTAASTGVFFIRNNNISISGNENIRLDITDMASACLELLGNTFDEDVRLSNGGTGNYDVERFLVGEGGPLDAVGVNTFNNASVVNSNGTITSRDPGFCAAQL